LTRSENDELLKVTINLYRADVAEMERIFGYGWSAELRELLHNYLNKRRTVAIVRDMLDDSRRSVD
jgi:hypothetical protein